MGTRYPIMYRSNLRSNGRFILESPVSRSNSKPRNREPNQDRRRVRLTPPTQIIPNPKMWRPGFVLWGRDFSKTYFPQEILAPSLAILCHHHTIQILSELRQKQIEPNECSLGRSGCKQPTVYDFKVVMWTFLNFEKSQNSNF